MVAEIKTLPITQEINAVIEGNRKQLVKAAKIGLRKHGRGAVVVCDDPEKQLKFGYITFNNPNKIISEELRRSIGEYNTRTQYIVHLIRKNGSGVISSSTQLVDYKPKR
ncbi:hypothetical protein A3A76_06125 [Candidatus Woesebacteria bacterium RIFCSPLOWO2_01_FULL_39_23]|uniref:Uncharacterized protein n=1 Tax=Candidatus Woesebacteria bacterium RIFCSPHIGHO2_01_FULL_40_22 TaxID=1802499 RepID=A0A1F7YJB5_9BACT|nr:MAG: hypothetical protein A2141_02820 [Candidatus Woesebacteria bacterium RBG_16_40_11]OGM26979.1 MAG: hypothetical protein A2628_06065 [Candidatus Woesebacteria bacterium RIFCSPHIGHO2_01_FULL_40_22]OGM37386.1 MAG: hypothetical protein A3E41_04470 [Candidatus Woesebacteria bacterium RIFCSPHIGHO2_12_FULL_38_9]OGM63254.1 MAG: hypothetical protein A3A76_06125 [Candidatus Woesebacteria bacterium RIFCSPLOWO2_01_FULL_39_23]